VDIKLKWSWGPSLYYVSKRTGLVGLENGLFDDDQYYIYADIVGRSEKVQKCADVIRVLQIAVTGSFQQIPKLCTGYLLLKRIL